MSNNLSSVIGEAKQSFIQKAPENMAFDKEAFFAYQALTKNKHSAQIAQQNQGSLKAAMINVAAIGLSLNPANQDAYLVPRDDAICLDISYKGLIKLATNTGSIKWVQAEIVYENDTFEFNGVGEKPVHKSNPFIDRGQPVGVYCVAKTHDGDYLVTTMDSAEIEAVKNTSKAKDSKFSPWTTFPLEMWKKSVIKRASKQWPKTDINGSDTLARAIDVLNEHEGLEEPVTKEMLEYFEQLISNNDALRAYTFFQSLEIEQQANLEGQYLTKHAEPKAKGKLREKLREIREHGKSMAFDYRDTLEESNDDLEINQIISELTDEDYRYIFSLLSSEAKKKINSIEKEVLTAYENPTKSKEIG